MKRRQFLSFFKKSSIATIAVASGASVASAHEKKSNNHSYLSSREFGLKPNQNFDQSHLLQNAILSASKKSKNLFIEAGAYLVSDLNIPSNMEIFGIKGQSILVQNGNASIFRVANKRNISLKNLEFRGDYRSAADAKLIDMVDVKNLVISDCVLADGNGSGIVLDACEATIENNHISNLGQVGIFATNGKNSKFIKNTLYNLDNNGILVWQSERQVDGSIVAQNHISKIGSKDGGSGQNGNGINVYKADNVMMNDNQIEDCYYTAIRINSGSNCQIINNNCRRSGEVAIYAEFGFNGVIINNNLVDGAGSGISITNLNEDGHLAICRGNLVRNVTQTHLPTQPLDPRGYGIAAEGDAMVEGNVIENCAAAGIGAGYGAFQRNITLNNNMIKEALYGIQLSVAQGAGRVNVSNNSITGTRDGGIYGYEWEQRATKDLIHKNQKFGDGPYKNLNLQNNVLT